MRRRQAFRAPRRIVHVYCEGRVTEPDYLQKCFRVARGGGDLVLDVEGGAGTPDTIVKKCVKKKRELSSGSLGRRDSIWAVFDVDDHPRLTHAYNLATQKKIDVAISNPCIEVWGLLHFCEVDAPMSRMEAQRLLHSKMAAYHHEKNPRFDWAICEPLVKTAISNAEKGCENRAAEGTPVPAGNPCSTFGRLVESIRRK